MLCTLEKFLDNLAKSLEVSMLNISQLSGDTDIDILSFVRKTRLNWIRNVNRLDC